jgi:hypothetical protein
VVFCSYLEYNAVTPSSSYAPFRSLVLYWFLHMIFIRTGNSKKQFIPSRLNSIPNQLLWEGIYICKRKICSWMTKVGNNSFLLQTKFGRKASGTISQRRFLPKKIIGKRKIHEKGRNRFFPTVSIRSESVWNDFSEKVFVKNKNDTYLDSSL